MRARTLLVSTAAAAIALPGVALAAPPDRAPVFPDVIPLPDTFAPEGIATGTGTTLYAGSLADGDVATIDLRTGAFDLLLDRDDGQAVGLATDASGRTLYVAGGQTGVVSIVDTDTGEATDVALPGAAFVNDVIVTRDAVWLTDSFTPTVYRVSLDGGEATAFAVVGDYTFLPGAFNFNGIEASADGDTLWVISSTAGELLRLDVAGVDASSTTVEATVVDTDTALTSGDGILRQGRDLVVVRNSLNEVVTLRLSPDGTSATLVDVATQADFAVPTTVAGVGSRLYVVNARFGQNGPAGTPVASEVVEVG